MTDLKRAAEETWGTFASVWIGMFGGGVCGAIILVFGGLIGRSGSTGSEYVGYFEWAEVWLGFLYGGLFGAVVTPIAYLFFVNKIGLAKAWGAATVGTLIGGLLGALAGPPAALAFGVSGFFIALAMKGREANGSKTQAEEPSNRP